MAQLGMTAKTIAGCFGVPISMVDSSQQPPYANSEASTLQYHSQCLQTHLTAIEVLMDAGLELPAPYGTEFDLDDLIWLDVGDADEGGARRDRRRRHDAERSAAQVLRPRAGAWRRYAVPASSSTSSLEALGESRSRRHGAALPR